MAKRLQLRGGTTSQHSSFTGAIREVTVDTDKDTLVVHDGSTAGGHPLATATNFKSTGIDDNATSTAITINSSENVGINVTNPGSFYSGSNNLVVKDGISIFDTTDSRLEFVDGTSGSEVYVGNIVYNHASNFMRFGVDVSERMRITSAGRIGIGTTAPDATLEVNSGSGDTNSIFKSTDNNCLIIISDNDSSSTIAVDNDGSGGALKFNTGGDGSYSGNSEAMRITSAGSVGIGTSSPTATLSVDGSAIFNESGADVDFRVESDTDTSAFYLNGGDSKVRIGSGSGNGKLNINGDGFSTSFSNPHLILRNGNNTTGDKTLIYSQVTSSGGAAFNPVAFGGLNTQHTLREGAFVVYVSDTQNVDLAADERLRITNDGFVGIGTASPSNTLHVSGSTGTRLQSDSNGLALTVYRTVSTSTIDVMHLNSNFGGTQTKNFQIEADGDVQNTNNSYGSLSDRRFKENETDANSQWEDIKALQIKNYNLKIHPDIKHLGVIAQDLEASGMNGLVKNKPDVFYTEDDVLPEGKNVGDVKEENYKEVKYSILYMKSIKALQEAMERIETLEAKVTALETTTP